MRSIFVRVEPTVRLVTDAWADDLLIVLHLLFDARQGHDRPEVNGKVLAHDPHVLVRL